MRHGKRVGVIQLPAEDPTIEVCTVPAEEEGIPVEMPMPLRREEVYVTPEKRERIGV